MKKVYNKNKSEKHIERKLSKDFIKHTGFNIFQAIDPIDEIKSINIPTSFYWGSDDTLISEDEFIKFFDRSTADIKKMRVIQNTNHFDDWVSEEMYFGYLFFNNLVQSYDTSTNLTPSDLELLKYFY